MGLQKEVLWVRLLLELCVAWLLQGGWQIEQRLIAGRDTRYQLAPHKQPGMVAVATCHDRESEKFEATT